MQAHYNNVVGAIGALVCGGVGLWLFAQCVLPFNAAPHVAALMFNSRSRNYNGMLLERKVPRLCEQTNGVSMLTRMLHDANAATIFAVVVRLRWRSVTVILRNASRSTSRRRTQHDDDVVCRVCLLAWDRFRIEAGAVLRCISRRWTLR